MGIVFGIVPVVCMVLGMGCVLVFLEDLMMMMVMMMMVMTMIVICRGFDGDDGGCVRRRRNLIVTVSVSIDRYQRRGDLGRLKGINMGSCLKGLGKVVGMKEMGVKVGRKMY